MPLGRGGLDYSYVSDRQMPPPVSSSAAAPESPPRGVGAMGGPPPPPQIPHADDMPAHGDYMRAPVPPPQRQPYPAQGMRVQYSQQAPDRDLAASRDYRPRQQEIDESLRRDLLRYIFEQTSNVHVHNEECTAALMQCLTQMLNALEVGIHKTEGRVIENMTYSAELQHDIGKCLSKLDGVTRYCRDTETHLVENLAETKGSARSVLQRFEQDGNKLDSIQTHLTQLANQVRDTPTYNDMKTNNEEMIAAISSRFASLDSTLQKLAENVSQVKAQNVTLTSALTSISERLSWLERADQDRLRRLSASSTVKTVPHMGMSGGTTMVGSEVDLLSSNDLSYGTAVEVKEQGYEGLMGARDTHHDRIVEEEEENLPRAPPIAPVVMDSGLPQSTMHRELPGSESSYNGDVNRLNGERMPEWHVSEEGVEEATAGPLTAVAVDSSLVEGEVDIGSASCSSDKSRGVDFNAEYTKPLLSPQQREVPTNTVVSIDRELPVGPSGAASEPQSDKDIVGDVELPVASFSAVGNGPARETADDLVKAMTEEGLEVECDEQGVVWNAGSRARALAGGFCDAGLAQLVALASPDSEDLRIDVAKLHVEGLGGEPELTRDFARKLLDVYQSNKASTGRVINDLTEWLAEGPLDGVLL